MLQGGGVEDDLRPMGLEDPLDAVVAADVGEHLLVRGLERHRDVVEVRLVMIQQQELSAGRTPPPGGRSLIRSIRPHP